MSAEQVIALYEKIFVATARMYEAATQGDWEMLVSIEAERSRMLAAVKPLDAEITLDEPSSQRKDALLKLILDDDLKIRDLVKAWMDQFEATMQSASQELRLLKKYGA